MYHDKSLSHHHLKKIQVIHPSNLTFIPRVCSFWMCFCCMNYYVIFSWYCVCVLFAQQHLQVKVDIRDPPEPWKCDVISVGTLASRERVRNQVTAFMRNLKIPHLKEKESSSKPPIFGGVPYLLFSLLHRSHVILLTHSIHVWYIYLHFP